MHSRRRKTIKQVVSVCVIGAPEFLESTFSYALPANAPENVQQNPFGYLVEVNFRNRKMIGVILGELDAEKVAHQKFDVKPITDVLSTVPILTPELVEVYTNVSNYYGTRLQSLLQLVIPSRSVQAEKEYLKSEFVSKSRQQLLSKTIRQSLVLSPTLNNWALTITKRVTADLKSDKRVLVVVPTEAALSIFESVMDDDLKNASAKLSGNMKMKEKYSNYLNVLGGRKNFVYGTRSASLAPFIPDVIYIWGDNDANLKERRSPYYNAREVCLNRNSNELYFVSYVPSFTVSRLAAMEYLESVTPSSDKLKNVAKNIQSVQSNYGEKLPSITFSSIRATLENKDPVLLLYPIKGYQNLLSCASCQDVARCQKCESVLLTNRGGQLRCPKCEDIHHTFSCPKCNGTKLKNIRIGAGEVTRQVGLAFPGTPVSESSLDAEEGILRTIKQRPQIIIATPGSEPIPELGYGTVVIMDAKYWSAVLSIEGTSDTLSRWFYAASLLRNDTLESQENSADQAAEDSSKKKSSKWGRKVLLIGEADLKYRNALQDLNPQIAINQELASRKMNEFPPYRRALTILGNPELIEGIIGGFDEFDVVGPFPLDDTVHKNSWNSNISTAGLECYLIRSQVKDSQLMAKKVLWAKSKTSLGWTTESGMKVKSGGKMDIKFIFDPREYI